MKLFTFQKQGHDITKPFDATADYSDPYGPFYEMSKQLGWSVWIWTLPSIHDFLTETAKRWMDTDYFKDHPLWVLEIPASEIAWMGLEDHCKDTGGAKIYLDPSPIRQAGDVPMGLVNAPIHREWVTEIHEHP